MTRVLRSQLLSRAGFAHGFSSRAGVDGMAKAVGYAPARLFEVSQVHGRAVRHVRALDVPAGVRAEDADALVALASSPSLAVAVRSADCLPLLLADPVTRAVAAVHAGWRGAVAGVVSAAVGELCALAEAPAWRLLAAVLPHIRGCCFEVGEDVAEQLVAAARGRRDVIEGRGRPRVALRGVVREQLRSCGVVTENVDDVAGCTRCEPQRFFSYRRDGAHAGRHLSVIVAG